MIISKVRIKDENETDSENTLEIFKIFSHIYNVRIVRTLHKQSQRYKELLGITSKSKQLNGALFAFYLRQLKDNNIVAVDPKTTQYFLTFKGLKMFELLECVDKIANISIGNMENINTKITIDLNKNRTWLEPVIKAEIQQVIKELVGN